MPKVKLEEVELAYEEQGVGSPLLLVTGLGTQLIHWPDGLCADLAARGFRVIRYDHRDSGASTVRRVLPRLGPLDLMRIATRRATLPYTLADIARDGIDLLDALGVDAPAHVVGFSLGGAIAQEMAVRYPRRVASLTTIASTTGQWRRSVAGLAGLRTMLAPPPRSRDAAERFLSRTLARVGSRAHPMRPEEVRDLARRAWDREGDPSGQLRLLVAALAAGDRTASLARIQCPTLVLHGADDRLMPVRAGEATAAAIPGARFQLIQDMGHDLPEAIWPFLVEAIGTLANVPGTPPARELRT